MPDQDQSQKVEGGTSKATTFTAWLTVGLVTVNLFVAAIVGASLWQSHNQYLLQAETNTQNLTHVLEENIAGLLDKIDVALLTTKAELETQLARGLDSRRIDALLAQQLNLQSEILSLRVTDPQGIVKYGPGVVAGANVDLSDRKFFTGLRDDANAGLVVGEPVLARISQKWVVVLARRINRPDGTFGGIVYANLDLAYLTKRFATIDIGPLGAITLRDSDLNLIVRYPEPKIPGGSAGTKIVSPQLQERLAANPEFGTYRATVKMDNTERINAYRRISRYPLYILVGVATQDHFEQWRRQAILTAALLTLFFLVSLLSTWGIVRVWKRRTEAMAEVVRQEARFQTVADYTYDWEYWQGPNREILYMTPSCERITGYRREEFQADPSLLLRIVHPEDAALMDCHMHEIDRQDLSELDFRITRRDGQVRWIAHHCCAVGAEDGASLGRRVGNRDITDRKEADLALRSLNETLEQRIIQAVADNMEKERLLIQQARLAAMGELIGNIAHQWRQPLNALALLQANIQDDFEFGDLTRESLRNYTEQGQHFIQKMSATIDDFRNFFRPHREMAMFSLSAAVNRALDIAGESFRSNSVAILFTPRDDQTVNGFSNEFSQVLLNILNNARDAIHHHGTTDGRVVIDVGHDRGHAWVSVRDNGGGIPAEVLPKIFDPYFTTKENGTGIGLYMSKMIMAHMNGSIEAHSTEDGAVFKIILALPLPPST